MTKIFRLFTVNPETKERGEVFINPDHIVAFATNEELNLINVDFANGVSVHIDPDFFAVMAQHALDIVPIMTEEEQMSMMEAQTSVDDTEYVDETPLEEPQDVENVSYEADDDGHPELEPETHAGEDDEYEPTENAQVEGSKY